MYDLSGYALAYIGFRLLLIETRSHGYYITNFRSPPLSMAPPRRFGVPVHMVHEDNEYPGLNPGETYIRHRTYVWVDVGRPELERHDYLAWSLAGALCFLFLLHR